MQTEIEKYSPSVVEQYLSVDQAVKHYEEFEALKTKLLKEEDYQKIADKFFIKKSGWRKLALVFNVTDAIVYAKRIDREDSTFLWEFTVKATAPNGRTTEAIGSCDSRERKFAHLEHDVKATAHTRAKSRAISDLIGAGEVSAEEMDPPNEVKNVTPKEKAPSGTVIKSGLEGNGKL